MGYNVYLVIKLLIFEIFASNVHVVRMYLFLISQDFRFLKAGVPRLFAPLYNLILKGKSLQLLISQWTKAISPDPGSDTLLGRF